VLLRLFSASLRLFLFDWTTGVSLSVSSRATISWILVLLSRATISWILVLLSRDLFVWLADPGQLQMLFGAIINLRNGSRTDPFSNILEMSLLPCLPYIRRPHSFKRSSLCTLHLHVAWGNKTNAYKNGTFIYLVQQFFDSVPRHLFMISKRWFFIFLLSYISHASSLPNWSIFFECNLIMQMGLHCSYLKPAVSRGL